MNTQRVGFKITGGKGFHIMFENGYTVSVQFGPGNYCENRDMRIGSDEDACGKAGCPTAEVAVWPRSGDMIKRRGWSDTVEGWQTPADVLSLLKWAASQKDVK